MQSLPHVTVEEFQEIVQNTPADEIQLVDVRELQELTVANLNPLGFRNYPLSHYEQWSDRILEELKPALPTYVMCHHGMRSAQMTAWLMERGFTDVYNISGGIHAWSQAIDPTIPQY